MQTLNFSNIKSKEKMQKLYWNDPQSIKKLTTSLMQNKISITSTDTLYGLLSTITKSGYYKLKQLKEISQDRPFLLLISSPEKLKNFIDSECLSEQTKNLIKKCWPGPLTLIFKAKENLPKFLTSKEKSIAIRCPKHDGLLNLLKLFDGLFSTSANKRGKKPPTKLEEIDDTFFDQIEYLVTEKESVGRKENLYNTLPSTVLDISKSKKNIPKVVREGRYKIEELEKIYGTKLEK